MTQRRHPIAALANFHFPTPGEIQRGIDATMRDVIRHDAKYNPQTVGNQQTVTPVGAAPVQNAPAPQGVGSGWQPFRALENPMPAGSSGDRVMAALTGTEPKPKAEEKK